MLMANTQSEEKGDKRQLPENIQNINMKVGKEEGKERAPTKTTTTVILTWRQDPTKSK